MLYQAFDVLLRGKKRYYAERLALLRARVWVRSSSGEYACLKLEDGDNDSSAYIDASYSFRHTAYY